MKTSIKKTEDLPKSRSSFFVLFSVMIFMMCTCSFSSSLSAHPDSTLIHSKLQLINRVRTYLVDSLGLEIGNHFYTRFFETEGMFSYVYISRRDSIKKTTRDPFIYFGTDTVQAQIKANNARVNGFDVMLYKTAGTSEAFLNKRLLEYDDISLIFVLVHEAIHRHKQNTNSKLPYEYEEALCDVVANAYCGQLSNVKNKVYKRFIKANKQIYRVINSCIKGETSKIECERKIKKKLNQKTLFLNDRFNFSVNNAFLLRYSDYAGHYFELEKRFEKSTNKITGVKRFMAGS
jgi:hypothetical protein